MSLTLYMTKGLPGSGKTTWALERLANENNGWGTRVNKDELRTMMHLGRFAKANERIVLAARDAIVVAALTRGQHVIVDDTNLDPRHEETLRSIARDVGATLEVVDFTDVPIDICLERNSRRQDKDPVPENIILNMYRRHIAKTKEHIYDPSLPHAVLVDLDGTLAHMNGRSPFEWDRVGEDSINPQVRHIVRSLADYKHIIIMSGRDEVCRPQTVEWLEQYDITYTDLIMREAGDNRRDSIVKRELFEKYVAPRYYPWLVLDDRNQVVRMWRDELGLTVWQVADGDF